MVAIAGIDHIVYSLIAVVHSYRGIKGQAVIQVVFDDPPARIKHIQCVLEGIHAQFFRCCEFSRPPAVMVDDGNLPPLMVVHVDRTSHLIQNVYPALRHREERGEMSHPVGN